jgi:hypothetical protein
MNKKLLLVLLLLGAAVASYGLLGEKESFKEKVVTDKNAEIAVKFTKYIFDYSKKYDSRKFYKRFAGVPLECREFVWDTLGELSSLTKPIKVTVPAMGKAKRYVYYNIDGKEYCFTVSLIKKRWQLRSIQKVKNN